MSTTNVVDLQPAGKPERKEPWVEAVGAGSCLAAVERRQVAENRCEYRFSVVRMEPGAGRGYTLDFRPEDVLDLPKLAQVLAATLVADGWLEPGLKDDLHCLADSLDWFLSLQEQRSDSEWIVVRRESLQKVLDHIWDSEIDSFRELSVEERNT